jgi:TolB-like protein
MSNEELGSGVVIDMAHELRTGAARLSNHCSISLFILNAWGVIGHDAPMVGSSPKTRTALFFVTSVLLGLAVGLTSGCAYSIGTGERRLPEGYKLVSIPVFKNATQEVGIEVPFTNAIIRELERSQIARVVPKPEAQVVLEGVVESVRYDVANQVSCGTTGACLVPSGTILNTEYRLTVSTRLILRRISDGHELWSEGFTTQKSYLAPKIGIEGLNSANALYNHSARHENISAMAVDLMSEAYGRLTENF